MIKNITETDIQVGLSWRKRTMGQTVLPGTRNSPGSH